MVKIFWKEDNGKILPPSEHRKKDEVFGNFWVQRVRIIVMIIFKQINRTMSSNTYQETIMNKKLLITGGTEVFR